MAKHDQAATSRVFERACTIHVKNSPFIFLEWALFEESCGRIDEANKVYDLLEQKIPKLALTSTRRINMNRRVGRPDEVKRLFQVAIDGSETDQGRIFFACKYSRYLSVVLNEIVAAKQVLEEQLKKVPSSFRLYLQLLDMEMTIKSDDLEKRVCAVLDRAIEAMEATEDQILFSQRKMEFLEDFGSNTQILMECFTKHNDLLKNTASTQKTAVKTSGGPISNENVKVSSFNDRLIGFKIIISLLAESGQVLVSCC